MYDYDRIERAIAYFDERFQEQPTIPEVARHVGLSESHFHRLFHHWAGITPKRFLEYVTAAHARRMLEESATVLETAWESGLSGPSRLHDLFITLEGVTPGQIQRRGEGLAMRYGFHHSPFGECLVAETERGVTALTFVPEGGRDHALEELALQWPEADLERDQAATGKTLERILAGMHGRADGAGGDRVRLLVRGTNFQVRVWEALLRIPPGCVTSYEQVASWTGKPRAVRAVGNAVGANPIPLLIPCHRVIRKTGAFGNYGGGPLRKRAILAWEAAHRDDQLAAAG